MHFESKEVFFFFNKSSKQPHIDGITAAQLGGTEYTVTHCGFMQEWKATKSVDQSVTKYKENSSVKSLKSIIIGHVSTSLIIL